jgi:protein-S-isoprenylcysteine O-methyltransferase Ste14
MYLGFLCALAGVAVYLSNVAAVVMIALYVAYMNRYQIEPEERALLAKFGPEYAAYMASVRRWL